MARFVLTLSLLMLQRQVITAAGGTLSANAIVTDVNLACESLWDAVRKSDKINVKNVINNLTIPFLGHLKNIKITNRYEHKKMQTIKDSLYSSDMADIAKLQQLNHGISKVLINSLIIDNTYEEFLQYVEGFNGQKIDNHLLIALAETVVSEDECGLEMILIEIHGLLTSRNSVNRFNILDLLMKTDDMLLKSISGTQSQQLLLYNLLNIVMHTEIKAYFVIQFAYNVLATLKKENYEGQLWKSKKDFAIRVNQAMLAFKMAMKYSSQQLIRNDPDEHIEDVTYIQLKNLFQAYIINERYLEDTFNFCKKQCHDYNPVEWNNKKQKCLGFYDPICTDQSQCQGYLFNCDTMNIDNHIEVCLSDQLDRRYKYIVNGKNETKGIKGFGCSKDLIEVYRGHGCETCVCTCHTLDENSDNKFSLDLITTRYSQNFVATGLRFVKENHYIHIQVQEGLLLPNGLINENTLNWVTYPSQPKQSSQIKYNNFKEISLDDLKAPKNHVITGIKFHETKYNNNQWRLGLLILTRPMNLTSGTLIKGEINSVLAAPSAFSNDEIQLKDNDIPTSVKGKSVDLSRSGQYVTLQRSGLSADVGQSTIPFIDKQPVQTYPPAPLSGAGIYHKGRKGSGGFIGLKVFTYNYEEHLNPNMDETNFH